MRRVEFLFALFLTLPISAQAETTDAAQACLAGAGPADAGVPASAAAAGAHRDALVEAADLCAEAGQSPNASGDVLFLASEVAQGRRDMAGAFALLERAAKLDFAPAETRLGDYYLFGAAPGGEDATKAVAHFQRAVELGDPAGMTTLALLYSVGKGVTRDAGKMVELLTQAADAGYHFAQFRLAQTYLTGEGIPGRADPALGIPDPARAAELFGAAAENGNQKAALELAALYADPNSGLPDDPDQQLRLIRMAASQDVPEAVAMLGVLYETGRGVAKNPEIAARIYVRAMESGKVAFDQLRAGAPGRWDRDTALAFQRLLQDRGLYTGALDAIVGPGTAAAARALAAE